jgi:hypothetical protein
LNLPAEFRSELSSLVDEFINDSKGQIFADKSLEAGFNKKAEDLAKKYCEQLESAFPGWKGMVNHGPIQLQREASRHILKVNLALQISPEYQKALPRDKCILEWSAWLHDLAKRPSWAEYPSQRRVDKEHLYPIHQEFDAQFQLIFEDVNADMLVFKDGVLDETIVGFLQQGMSIVLVDQLLMAHHRIGDSTHAFRSVVDAAKSLYRSGFPVWGMSVGGDLQESESFQELERLVQSAVVYNPALGHLVQDNTKVGDVLNAIRELFGNRDSQEALLPGMTMAEQILRTVFLHQSLPDLVTYPNVAALTDEQIGKWIDMDTFRLLSIFIPVDSMSFRLHDESLLTKYQAEIKANMDRTATIISQSSMTTSQNPKEIGS